MGILCLPTWLPQYKYMEIFSNLDSCNSCIFWYIDLKLRDTSKWGYLYGVKVLSKSCQFNILMMSLQTTNSSEEEADLSQTSI